MSDTFWGRLTRGACRVRQRPGWDALAGDGWPARIMGLDVTDRFHAKQGRSTARWVLQGERRLAVYLKRHYRLPWWEGWLATLWPDAGWSPAFREWDHLEWAKAQGLPVPHAVAAAEWLRPGGRLQSFLAVEELADMIPLHEAIPAAAARLAPAAFERWKRGLAAELARLTRALHDRRRFHKDLYLCHFFIPRQDTGAVPGWPGRVHLIDLHRLGHHRRTWRWWLVKDLGQLLYSSDLPGVGVRDRLRFWRCYRANGRGAAERWARRLIVAKWRRYRRHNRKNLVRPRAA
jgi:heptose I phosphotransferase